MPGYRRATGNGRPYIDIRRNRIVGLRADHHRKSASDCDFRQSARTHRRDDRVRRRAFITLLGGAAAAWPLAARAQQSGQIPNIGWFKIQDRQHTPGQLQAFRDGMRALGLAEGRDYEIEERYADDDEARLPTLTTELLNAGASIILATSQPSIIA